MSPSFPSHFKDLHRSNFVSRELQLHICKEQMVSNKKTVFFFFFALVLLLLVYHKQSVKCLNSGKMNKWTAIIFNSWRYTDRLLRRNVWANLSMENNVLFLRWVHVLTSRRGVLVLESRPSHVTRRCLWEELGDGDDGKTICVSADQHNYRLLNKTSNIFCSSDNFCKLFLLLIIFHFTGILWKIWFIHVLDSETPGLNWTSADKIYYFFLLLFLL